MALPSSPTEDLLNGMMNRSRCMNANFDFDDTDDENGAHVAAFQRAPFVQLTIPAQVPTISRTWCVTCAVKKDTRSPIAPSEHRDIKSSAIIVVATAIEINAAITTLTMFPQHQSRSEGCTSWKIQVMPRRVIMKL